MAVLANHLRHEEIFGLAKKMSCFQLMSYCRRFSNDAENDAIGAMWGERVSPADVPARLVESDSIQEEVGTKRLSRTRKLGAYVRRIVRSKK